MRINTLSKLNAICLFQRVQSQLFTFSRIFPMLRWIPSRLRVFSSDLWITNVLLEEVLGILEFRKYNSSALVEASAKWNFPECFCFEETNAVFEQFKLSNRCDVSCGVPCDVRSFHFRTLSRGLSWRSKMSCFSEYFFFYVRMERHPWRSIDCSIHPPPCLIKINPLSSG